MLFRRSMLISSVAAVLVMATAAPVSADHQSFLSPKIDGSHVRFFWDDNNNLVPDTGPINWYAKGTGWTTLAKTRFDAAANEWDGDTLFNIDTFMWTTGTSNNRLVWRGNSDSSCPIPAGNPATAGNTISWGPIFNSSTGELRHYKLKTSCISFNTSDYTFWFGSGQGAGYYDWQGILTHEFGHSVYLEHPDVAEGDPACNYGAGDVDSLPSLCPNDTSLPVSVQQNVSFWRRTLEPIDVHNANWVY